MSDNKSQYAEYMVSGYMPDDIGFVKVFSSVCDRLVDSIIHQKIIQDTTLLIFNRITNAVISNSINRRTDSFYELSRLIGNYRRYEFSKETNSERGCSYIRLYQMINMIETFDSEQEIKLTVHIDTKENDNSKTVIKQIYHSPGITFKNLKNKTFVSNEKLSKQLQVLENKDYVFRRNFGKDHYYFLTNKGDFLYQHLFSESYEWADDWSNERIYVLSYLLRRIGKSKNKTILVQKILKPFFTCSEENIKKYYSQIKNRELWLSTNKENCIETETDDFLVIDFKSLL